MTDHVDRRSFVSQSAALGAAAFAATARGSSESPNETIVVGVMGLSRGRALAQGFARLANVEVKYVCDVDKNRASAGASALEKMDKKTKPIGDFRTILDDKDVDALVCAAPNHWHSPATILGCAAGKHVYVEKPCSHNPHEGELMVQAARKHKRAVQMGSQRRSSPTAHEAIALLRDGAIGRVYCARSWYFNSRGSIGTGKSAPVPDYLNYELWQGPAPRTPYVDNRIHYNWHWLWHWGNGELGNNGVHALDVCRWGLDVDFPVRVVSSGGRYAYQDDQQTPDTHIASFEFEGRKTISWQGHSCNRNGEGFVKFYGEKGMLALDGRCRYELFDAKGKLIKQSKANSGDAEHLQNFVDAIRNDQPLSLNAEIAEGHKSTLLCHLGNIAHRTGRTLRCNPVDGHVLDDKQAEKHWSRHYAKGWEPSV